MCRIESYVPESEQIAGKDRDPVIFRQDCAVLIWQNGFSPIASREAEPFDWKVALSHLSAPIFEESSCLRLTKTGDDAILLFGEAFSATGLVLAVRLPYSCASVREVLFRMGIEFYSEDTCSEKPLKKEVSALCERLPELFFYTESVFKGNPLRRAQLSKIARFAGCRLDENKLPMQGVELSPADAKRMGLFLLSVFLILRRKTGKVQSRAQADGECCCLKLQQCGKSENLVPLDSLSIPCFSDYSVFENEQGVFAEAKVRKPGDYRVVRSAPAEISFLSFSFSVQVV